jgi:hypothetical protein
MFTSRVTIAVANDIRSADMNDINAAANLSHLHLMLISNLSTIYSVALSNLSTIHSGAINGPRGVSSRILPKAFVGGRGRPARVG